MPEQPAGEKQRRMQFRLRTLLLLLAVLSGGFAWMGYAMRQATAQRDAVREIRKLGGGAYYDYQATEFPDRFNENLSPPGPVWIREILGDDFFGSVVYVDLADCAATDRDLIWLQYLPYLKVLRLRMAPISDDGLAHLAGLKRMEELRLESTSITGRGFKHLQQLPRLEFLALRATEVNADGLKEIAIVPNLKYVDLSDTPLSQRDLAEFKQSRPDIDVVCAFLRSKEGD